MKNIIKKTIAIKISILLIFQQTMIAESIVVDNSAPLENQATVEAARNNVPVVNIVAPNAQGLSHNKFRDYNVNKEGVILNNSNQRDVNTQLSGYIYGNKNLAGGSTAQTILNEVTSKNKSELRGFTEVAGNRAKVVVANPNGIYINGAGFINTSKATITTGKINIENNQIKNFEVRNGEIQIDGDGLNTTNVDKAELYAKTVKLNAQIHAKDIDIVTGKNKISEDGTIEKIDEADSEKPSFSLDSSSLGGIYANKINLIGTQAGVGVNLPIEIAAQDNLKLSADGKIILDKVISQKSIEINSISSDVNTNNIYGNNIKIEAKNELNNKDIIASKTDINLKATKIVNENLIASGVTEELKDSTNGNLTINSENLENKKILYAKDNITINSTNIKNSQNSNINSKKTITIKSKNIENEDNVTIQANNIDINANNFNGKSLYMVALNGDLKLDTNNLNLTGDNLSKGLLYSTNDILISSKNFISNYLNIQANNNIDINSLNLSLNNSSIQSVVYINDIYENGYKQGNINLISNKLALSNTSLSSKDLNIKNQEDDKLEKLIVNNSLLDVNNDINILTSNFNTTNSTYLALRDVFLLSDSIKDDANNTIFSNSVFKSGNSMNITIDDDISLDSTNSFEATNSIFLNSKSLINSAEFISNNNITINTSDYLVNNALLSSGNIITLNANNYIINNDSNKALFGIRGAFTNLNTNVLTNYGLISSLYEMNIKANDIVNYGGIASGNADNYSSVMSITANNLTNYNTIYSNDSVNLFIKNNLLNKTDNNVVNLGNQNATIFATNNITIQGDEDKTFRTQNIINDKSIIQTNNGDINIFANNLENLASELNIKGEFIQNENGSMYIDGGDRINTESYRDNGGYTYNNFTIYTDIMSYEKPRIAQILSGKDIYFNTNNITNNYSLISANNNLYFESNVLSNNDVDIIKLTTTKKDIYTHEKKCRAGRWGCKDYSIYRETQTTYDVNVIDKINSTIEAGGSILGSAGNLVNGNENAIIEFTSYNPTTNTDVKSSNLSTSIKNTQNQTVSSNEIVIQTINNNYELPTNKYGMFRTVDSNKNLNYLVETNPLYTNLSNYIGSQYFLDKMNYKSDRVTKRLGDAAYETKLVSQAIIQQTGQRFLNAEYTSENIQFVALMNNAVNLSGILDLEIGQALTQTQLANLTEDIVWMEEKIVNGQSVLVPVVYLAKDYEHLKGASIVAGNSIDLKVKDSVNNSGNIKSKDYINLSANSITNNTGVILSNGNVNLIANENIVNKNGGIIKASNVQIVSTNGDIINQIFSKQNTINNGANNFTYTQIGNQSQIEATNGSLVLQANNNIENIGANLSALKTLSLNAINGDVNLKTIELKNEHNIYYSGGFNKALDIENLPSTASSGESVVIKAGKDINLEAVKLNATNQINLNATNDVNITAVNDEHYKDVQTSSKGFLSKKTQRDMSYKEEVVSSELNANDIVINASNNVNLEAAKLKANENIIVNAKDGDVNILAKEYREGELHSTKKSSWGGLKKSLDIKSSDALKLNSALLETQAANVVITSGKDINILASEINSGADIQLKALNDVLIASQEEYLKTKEVHEKSSFNIAGLAGLVVPVGGSIYTQEIHKNDKVSSTNKQSSLIAKENIIVDSGTTNIIGSNLEANNISIKADTGEINILSSQDIANETSLDKKIELSLSNPINMIKSQLEGLKDKQTKLKFEVGSLTYDEVDKASQNTTNNSSNLIAKENLVLDSLSDINITGSNLIADENIGLNSQIGDINILNSVDTSAEDIKEKHAIAELNVTVQNEYVETAQAVKSAVESAKQLKQTKDDYSNYKSEVKKLENTLSNLKQSYKNKEVGIDYTDIEDLIDIIDNVKSQEKYYVAAIAAASADLASKTVAVATQGKAAASSTGTAGFSVGVSLDVNGSKTKTNTTSQTSNASNLSAKNIYLNTDETLNTNINITGSNLIAQDNLDINTTNLNVKASQDTITSTQDSKSVNGSVAFTMYGGGGGTAGLGYGQQNSDSNTLINNNSILQANNVNINASNDASFIGANVKANDTLNLNVGNNLVLESLRDEYSSNSNGFNVNAGIGFGSAGAPAKRSPSLDVGKQSSTNAGFSVNNGTTLNKQTVLSSITGNEVNVNVGNNTHLKGALISAGNFTEDGSFVDNKNLNFTTNTLSFENLSNTTYSLNQSIGGSLNYNLTDSRIVNTEEKKDIEKGISSVKYNSDKSLSVNVSKTLATLGQGNINIKDTANSDDLERLNSDTSKINKDLYSSSTGTKVDATLDTRLLSIKGIDQIKDDYNTATAITNAIEQIVTNNKVGIIDFFNETQKNVDVYNGVKAKIANDEELAKQLQNSDLNPTDKQNMLKEVALTVMKELGYVSNDVKIVSTDDIGKNETLVKGYYDPKTQTSFVNDKYNDSTTELLASLGHEISHDMDKQNGIFVSNDKDQNIYATNFGEDLAFYTNGALDIIKGGSLSNTNNHNNGIVITTMPSIFNSSNNVLNSNNVQFSLLDKSGGDDSISKIVINVNEYKNKTNYGTALVYVDGESKPREIKITSGRDTFDYTKSNAGPTPPGVYLIDPNKSQNMSVNDRIDGINQSTNELSLFNFIKKYSDDWGIFRVPLEPANSTNTYNRTGMYIHGGTFDGSIGCIDCGNNDKWLFGEVRDTKKFIPVEIKYDENYKK